MKSSIKYDSQYKPNRGYDLIRIVMAKSYQINFIKNLLERNYLNKLNLY